MTRVAHVLIATFILVLAACATNEFSQTRSLVNGLSLKNSKIIAYSFLDVRDAEFGPSMLNEFDRQLADELLKSGITLSILRFKDSALGQQYSFTNSGMQIPVRDTIVANLANERSMGADYRLIIFPSQMTLRGAWKFYDVRWDLLDVRTGKRVWSTTSRGRHLTAWKSDELPEARAKTMVDGIVEELRKSNLL
jgi:hypothetical protein